MQTKRTRVVTVFGSSAVRAGQAEFALAERLGRLLAERGYTICNGGYMGSMEASAKGAHDAGGSVIGVTVGEFSNRTPNPYLTEEIPEKTLLDRIRTLVQTGDAYIVLSGGIGTLAELFIVWNHAVMNCMPPRPILLLGNNYPELLKCFERLAEIGPEQLRHLEKVSTPEEALLRLDQHFENAD